MKQKRLLSVFLAACMVFTMLPAPAFAAEQDVRAEDTAFDAIAENTGSTAPDISEADAELQPLGAVNAVRTFDVSQGNIKIEDGADSGTLKVTYGVSTVEDNIPVDDMLTIAQADLEHPPPTQSRSTRRRAKRSASPSRG